MKRNWARYIARQVAGLTVLAALAGAIAAAGWIAAQRGAR